VKTKTAGKRNSLKEQDMRNCFEHWQHGMQLCVGLEGNCVEGDCS